MAELRDFLSIRLMDVTYLLIYQKVLNSETLISKLTNDCKQCSFGVRVEKIVILPHYSKPRLTWSVEGLVILRKVELKHSCQNHGQGDQQPLVSKRNLKCLRKLYQ